MQKMTRGGESAYEELFQYACPKFITPTPPSLDAPSMNTNQVHPDSLSGVDGFQKGTIVPQEDLL